MTGKRNAVDPVAGIKNMRIAFIGAIFELNMVPDVNLIRIKIYFPPKWLNRRNMIRKGNIPPIPYEMHKTGIGKNAL